MFLNCVYISGNDDENDDHDEEDEEDEDDDDDVAAPVQEGSYDPSEFDHLNVDPEIKDLFVQILKYTPQTVDIEFKFRYSAAL